MQRLTVKFVVDMHPGRLLLLATEVWASILFRADFVTLASMLRWMEIMAHSLSDGNPA